MWCFFENDHYNCVIFNNVLATSVIQFFIWWNYADYAMYWVTSPWEAWMRTSVAALLCFLLALWLCLSSLVGASLTTISSILYIDGSRHVGGTCVHERKELQCFFCGREDSFDESFHRCVCRVWSRMTTSWLQRDFRLRETYLSSVTVLYFITHWVVELNLV